MAVENKDLSMYENNIKELREGEIIKGVIAAITKKDVLVDVGYKSEGAIPVNEFSDISSLKVGDEIEVLLETKENEEGNIVLSRRKAEKTKGWDKIINEYKEGDTVEGRVTKKVKGGLMVDIGVEAFLPASLIWLKGFGNINQLLGQSLKFKILTINKPRRNIVLSRKDALIKEKEESKAKLLDGLEKGHLKSGTVKNITDFGAFVDLGGIDGLLHITDMSWERISHPSELLAVGNKIEVMILDFDKESMKISLGLKQKTPSPWKNVETKYPVGSKVKAKVTNLVAYGAFVELEKGLEGLIHISEFSWTKRITSPNDVLAIGDVIEAVVLSIDSQSQKISLGIKQLEANPWADMASRYPLNTPVKGKIRNLTDYGAFVELEDGVDGFVSLEDISWTRKVNHPKEVLKKGQKVEAIVVSVEPQNQKVSLSIKQATPDPWPQISQKFVPNSVMEGKITKITNFGIFVELEKDLEGLVHISEIGQEPSADLNLSYKVDDKIKVKILKVDAEQRKIALSLKGV